jgi:dipeptidyl aminopeptidase/acylaminoacyl peptidase
LPKGYTQVYVIDAELGGTPRQITSGDYNHSDPQWSSDGKTIYLSGIGKPEAEYTWGDSEIYAIDLKTLDIKTLTDRQGPDGGARISPDGKWIAYTGYDEKKLTSHLSSLYLMDAGGSSKKLLAGQRRLGGRRLGRYLSNGGERGGQSLFRLDRRCCTEDHQGRACSFRSIPGRIRWNMRSDLLSITWPTSRRRPWS